jgi:BON domain
MLHSTVRMRWNTRVRLALVTALGAALSGCAAYGTFEKCGYSGCPGDAQISAAVRARLNEHPALGPPNLIYVKTLDGVVYLSGQVATELQRATADTVAQEAPGAVKVVDIIGLEYNGR